MSKKELEKSKRKLAEQQAIDREKSKNRQEKLIVRWDLDLQKLKDSKNPEERRLIELRLKGEKLRKLRSGFRSSLNDNVLWDELGELIEIVLLQDEEIEYLAQFRRGWELIEAHYPHELKSLWGRSFHVSFQRSVEKLTTRRDAKEAWELKRQHYKGNLIEWEFGLQHCSASHPYGRRR